MKQLSFLSAVALILSSNSFVWADVNGWGNYRGIDRSQKNYPTKTYKYTDQYGRQMSEEVPIRPQYGRSYPIYPNHHYPNQPYPIYPTQNGVTIIYNHQFPTRTEYSGSSYGYVNGGGRVESSQYTLISDWRRYGLPDPQVGMHWIFENGRYLQIENGR